MSSTSVAPGVATSIPARSHNFVEIDHEIISTVISPLSRGLLLDWLQSFKQFFINVSYHILVASLTLMTFFKDWFNWHYKIRGGASLHPSIPNLIDIYLFLMVLI